MKLAQTLYVVIRILRKHGMRRKERKGGQQEAIHVKTNSDCI